MNQKSMKIIGIDITGSYRKFPCLVAGMRNSMCSSLGAPVQEFLTEVQYRMVCVRYVFDTAVEENSKNSRQIAMTKLGEHYRWSSIIKLYEIDGQPAFS